MFFIDHKDFSLTDVEALAFLNKDQPLSAVKIPLVFFARKVFHNCSLEVIDAIS